MLADTAWTQRHKAAFYLKWFITIATEVGDELVRMVEAGALQGVHYVTL